ncbi:hypothetical protein [Culturomica massiliensis]|jgi:hypothetical protein|nr:MULTISPECIES: hypothetical protein [Odoribacteraceae]
MCVKAGDLKAEITEAAAGPNGVRCRRKASRKAPAANGHGSAGG